MPAEASGLVVALSGGLDSAVLATALSRAGTPFRGLSLRAVHVDHGLQGAAADFRRGCEALCRRLSLPLTVIEVRVATPRGASVEAAARDARYDGLARELAVDECLLTAHHATDQAETVLLQLLRGAGLKGLAAMPLCRPLGAGWHLRPLIDVVKDELLRFAAREGIGAVADPMNGDLRFDRAFLRARVWPLLAGRWPGAAVALSRTARHAADAQALLDEAAAPLMSALRDGDGLSVTGLRALSASRRANVVRQWIATRAARTDPPPTARLREGLRQILDADEARLPSMVWGAHALRRYRDRLLITAAHPPRMSGQRAWPPFSGDLALGPALGTLRWSARGGGLNPDRLDAVSVRGRRGGETLKPQRAAKVQSVQHLCQSLGVLPWMRDALPFVYAGASLVAVGDLWQDARFCVPAGARGVGIEWENAPELV